MRKTDIHVLMDQVAFVFQNNRMFKTSILENVLRKRTDIYLEFLRIRYLLCQLAVKPVYTGGLQQHGRAAPLRDPRGVPRPELRAFGFPPRSVGAPGRRRPEKPRSKPSSSRTSFR